MIKFFSFVAPFLAEWAVRFFTKKIFTFVAAVGAFLIMTAVFIVCIKKLVLGLYMAAVCPTWILTGMSMFLPFNLATVLSTIISAKSCRWAYDRAIEKIKLLNSAT